MGKQFIDGFTPLHLGWGFLIGRIGFGFIPAVLLSLGFELLEGGAKEYVPSIFPEPIQDSPRNLVGDTLAVLVGWWLGKGMRP